MYHFVIYMLFHLFCSKWFSQGLANEKINWEETRKRMQVMKHLKESKGVEVSF